MLPTLTSLPDLANLPLPDLMLRLALAVGIGVLIGGQRERASSDPSSPGVRTFTILALTGAISILFGAVALAATVLAATAVALSPSLRWRHKSEDRPGYGATTVAAALAATLLGALSCLNPALAAAAAVVLVIALASKDRLHTFIQDTITRTELNDALKFFVVAVIVLPLLPDTTFGPFAAINPHKIGLLVTALTGIGWLGYIAVRAFGASRGLPLAGLAGGLVSSTATTAAMARRARTTALRRPAIAAALLSKVSSLSTLLVLVGFISLPVLAKLSIPAAAMIITLLLTARVFAKAPELPADASKKDKRKAKEAEIALAEDPGVELGRPFALKPALILAGIITVALFVSKLVVHYLGDQIVIVVSAVTGIADTQAAAVATADVAATHGMSTTFAMLAIVTALLTNTLFKIALARVGGGPKVARLVVKALAPATLVLLTTAAAVALLWP